jgi:hypothetical protein
MPRRSTRPRLATTAPGRAQKLGLAACLVAGLAGCHPHISGNGVLLEAGCKVNGFSAVKLDLGIAATITVDPLASGTTCILSGDANLVRNIEFAAPGGVLQISSAPDFDRILPLELRITAQALTAVEASDAGAQTGDATVVTVAGAATSQLAVVGHDASRITVAGPGASAGTATVELSEAAIFFGFGYPVASASVSLSGQGHAQLDSAGPVTGLAAGQSQVEVQGGGACAMALAGTATCTLH